MHQFRILCLSGSLRRSSYNTALIQALPFLAPDEFDMIVDTSLGTLPLFNPDHEEDDIASVRELKNLVRISDGLIIASPEYAHGISGVLKNALDWLVSTVDFPGMPVALLNASPRATHAQAALREVINTMSGDIVEDASISIPLLGSNLDSTGITNSGEISNKIRESLYVFLNHLAQRRDVFDV